MEGAIHIINTLKSVNDKSLSDWQGVIGEELIAQRAQREEQEENLRELIDRVESLYGSQQLVHLGERSDATGILQADVEAIRSDLRMLASQIGGTPIRYKKASLPLQPVEKPCPQCSNAVQYQQRPKPNSYKSITCKQCDARLVSRFGDGEFTLSLRVSVIETVACPICAEPLEIALDSLPGSATVATCDSCNASVRVYRTATSVGVRLLQVHVPKERIVDETLLDRIKDSMPTQPWPKGTAKIVAAKLGLSKAQVALAINELIRRGVFKPQIDGQLYVREESQLS